MTNADQALLDQRAKKLDAKSVLRLAKRSPALARRALEGLSVYREGIEHAKYAVALAPLVLVPASWHPRASSLIEDALEAVLLAALQTKRRSLFERARERLLGARFVSTMSLQVTGGLIAEKKRRRNDALAILGVAIERSDASGTVFERTFELLATPGAVDVPHRAHVARWLALAEAKASKDPEIWTALARWACEKGELERSLAYLERAASHDALPSLASLKKKGGFAALGKDARFVSLLARTKPAVFGTGALRGVPLVDRCILHLSRTRGAPKRARPAVAARLEGPVLGRGVGLPPTLRRFLAYDLTFETLPAPKGGLKNTGGFGRNGSTPTFEPIAADVVVRRALEATFGVAYARLPIGGGDRKRLDAVIRTFEKARGRFFALPSAGDQQHYLYAGRADADGELPILGVEVDALCTKDTFELAELGIWVKYPSFDLFVAALGGCIDPPNARPEFAALCRRHLKKNPELRGLG